jgi:hypothetical protein
LQISSLIWASRFASLASGYPLHHPRRHFMASRVVSLLSLSPRTSGARTPQHDKKKYLDMRQKNRNFAAEKH